MDEGPEALGPIAVTVEVWVAEPVDRAVVEDAVRIEGATVTVTLGLEVTVVVVV
jgi:hypothetical protein